MNLQVPSTTESDTGPGEVGDLLRASRLRHGQELADVARTLRIRTVYLQAIEDSRYEDLPGTVYAIGFIRSYAEHLGLDGEQLVDRFKAEASGTRTTRKPLMNLPAMVPDNGIPRGAVIALGALLLVGAYGAWYFLSTKDMYVADLIPPVPETITRALEAGRSSIAAVAERARTDPAAVRSSEQKSAETSVTIVPPPPPAVPSIAAPAPTLAPAPLPAPTPSVAQPAPVSVAPADSAHDEDDEEAERTPPPSLASSAPAAQTPPAAPVQSAQPSAPPSTQPSTQPSAPVSALQTPVAAPTAKPAVPQPVAEAPATDASPVALDDRGGVDAPASGSQLASLPGASTDPDREIILKANVDSWIQIRDTTENKLVLTRLLRKGEQYTVPSREGLSLVTGNAGGLDVTVGGDSVPSLGAIGVVKRNIMLDPERLRAGTAIVE